MRNIHFESTNPSVHRKPLQNLSPDHNHKVMILHFMFLIAEIAEGNSEAMKCPHH